MGRTLETKAARTGGEFELCPEGNHRCALIALIELGTHSESYQGGAEKDTEKIYAVYELLDEEKSYVVGRMYTFSLGEKAAFRKVASAVMQRPLANNEKIDVERFVGKPLMVQVNHTESGSKTYGNVGDVTAVPKALQKSPVKPSQVPFYASLGSYRDHAWVPYIYGQSVAEKIAESQEMKGGKATEAEEDGENDENDTSPDTPLTAPPHGSVY